MSAIPRKPPCVRCNRTHHTPQAFLLECCRCRRAWHHSCHLPPLSEDQVLALVEGDGSRQFGEGLSSWQCRRCSKKPREAGHINTRPSASKLQLDIPSGTTSRVDDVQALPRSDHSRNIDLGLDAPNIRPETRRELAAPLAIPKAPSSQVGRRTEREVTATSTTSKTAPQPLSKPHVARKGATTSSKRTTSSYSGGPLPDAPVLSHRPSPCSESPPGVLPEPPFSRTQESHPKVSAHRPLEQTGQFSSGTSSTPVSASSPTFLPASSTSDFRALIASMRAAGKLQGPPPSFSIPSSPPPTSVPSSSPPRLRSSSILVPTVRTAPASRAETEGLEYVTPPPARPHSTAASHTVPTRRAETEGLEYVTPPPRSRSAAARPTRTETDGLEHIDPPAPRARPTPARVSPLGRGGAHMHVDPSGSQKATPCPREDAGTRPAVKPPPGSNLLFYHMDARRADAQPGRRDAFDSMLAARAQRLALRNARAEAGEEGRVGRRKPLAKKLGRKAREHREEQGMNFVKTNWVAAGRRAETIAIAA